MTHAYSELYVSDAKGSLSQFFDYLINDCGLQGDWAASLFVTTGYAEQFERGNHGVISGMSGVELARSVVKKAYAGKSLPEPQFREDHSPAYWAGWALAEYQWYTGRRFKDIFQRVRFSEILSMYSVYHEMDISQFIATMEKRYADAALETKLKQIRESRGVSQAELAELSGVNLRSIQMYEQKGNDIDKAQAKTLYRISRVLGCHIEDLLESPMQY